MQFNPSTGSPSLVSTCCHKLFISLVSMFKFSWLLGRRVPRQLSASDPLKERIVSQLFVLSLSSMFLASSMWELRSLYLPACPAPPCQVVIVWVLYAAQSDWYLSLIFLSTVLSGECTRSLLLVWHPVRCSVLCK